ncbi:hypothetical protein S1OALGB6SA_873 [Olavius algarvensis spirochete endosymbiont]|uniref:type II secretion system F family protein n=1 Tax=Olavius algarvensis spirochete endosymbiont TaxID=260710 RepID=UPI000F0EC12D|nr:type II secretion system F family protein [Olavius algarvensis spirochete endosymbiont]CAD7837564.1 MAG: hypothetical protein [Olavius algarvensis spirochete endosymbiont]VDA99800.1 hypothetical protein S1OALGB6SA_873 [Olavius algarvensis spirochete endosymbiont]
MPVFHCRRKTANGKTVTEYRYAPNENQAIQEITNEGGIPIKIIPARKGRGRIKLKLDDSRRLSTMLALLINSGHRLKTSLELAALADENKRIGMACIIWRDELEKGRGFKEALTVSPVRLPPSFTALTSIGESVGRLGSVFSRLGQYYQKLSGMKNKFISSMIYPTIVLLFTIAAFLFLSIMVVPTLSEFSNVLMREPALTEGTEAEENWLFAIRIMVIAAAAGIIVFLTLFVIRRKDMLAKGFLKIPFVGAFIMEWNLMNWAFAVEMILEGGLTLSQALKESLSSVGNRYLRSVLARVAHSSESGESLSILFRKELIIPPIVASWIKLGENTGSSSEIFGHIRSYFEELTERKISIVSQLIEPILILIVGIIVISFVAIFVLPLLLPVTGDIA